MRIHDVDVSGSLDLHSRSLHVRAIREQSREADFICSTDSIDSYGEIVEQDWNIKRYLTNPVVLFAHCQRDLPIGKASNVRVENGALQATITFASERANPLAENVWQSLVEGTLRAVSVGFDPGEIRNERRDGADVCVLAKNELYEISVTPLPANAEALMKSRAKARALVTGAERAAGAPMPTPVVPAATPAAELVTLHVADLEDVTKALDAARADMKAVEAQNTHLVTERDALAIRTKAAEDKLVELEVDALVGVKLTPAERGDFIELAKSNRGLFEKMVAQRADLHLLGAPIVAPAPVEPTAIAATTEADPGADLDARVKRLTSTRPTR